MNCHAYIYICVDISKRENEARRNLAEIKNNHEKELTATISQSEKLQVCFGAQVIY